MLQLFYCTPQDDIVLTFQGFLLADQLFFQKTLQLFASKSRCHFLACRWRALIAPFQLRELTSNALTFP